MQVTLRRENGRWFDAKVPKRYQDVIIISVPHTGTVFLREVLYCNYFHCDDLTPEKLAETVEGKIVVSPLRDPVDVWRSWVKREGTGLQLPRERFTENWKRLAQMDRDYDVHYVCVDRPERDEQLRVVEKKLSDPRRISKRLHTDWKPLNSVSGEVSEKPEIDWVYELDPVRKYYGI